MKTRITVADLRPLRTLGREEQVQVAGGFWNPPGFDPRRYCRWVYYRGRRYFSCPR